MKINDNSYEHSQRSFLRAVPGGGNVSRRPPWPVRGTSQTQENLPWARRRGEVWILANFTLEYERAKIRPKPSPTQVGDRRCLCGEI